MTHSTVCRILFSFKGIFSVIFETFPDRYHLFHNFTPGPLIRNCGVEPIHQLNRAGKSWAITRTSKHGSDLLAMLLALNSGFIKGLNLSLHSQQCGPNPLCACASFCLTCTQETGRVIQGKIIKHFLVILFQIQQNLFASKHIEFFVQFMLICVSLLQVFGKLLPFLIKDSTDFPYIKCTRKWRNSENLRVLDFQNKITCSLLKCKNLFASEQIVYHKDIYNMLTDKICLYCKLLPFSFKNRQNVNLSFFCALSPNSQCELIVLRPSSCFSRHSKLKQRPCT